MDRCVETTNTLQAVKRNSLHISRRLHPKMFFFLILHYTCILSDPLCFLLIDIKTIRQKLFNRSLTFNNKYKSV